MHFSAAKLRVIGTLGVAQTVGWAGTYYLPAVLAAPMAQSLGVAPSVVFGLFSLALLIAAWVGPYAGRRVDRWGGKSMLAGTSVGFAISLVLLAWSPNVWVMGLAWCGIGIGVASGLYEVAFATVVRMYGRDARGAITGITLVAGFASTLSWPVTAYLESVWGWRSTCLFWAATQLLVCWPLYWSLPADNAPSAAPAADAVAAPAAHMAATEAAPAGATPQRDVRLYLLAFVFAATGFISTGLIAHFPALLQAVGVSAAVAIGVGMLIGPSQVVARVLEFTLLQRLHPVTSARLAAAFHPLAAALLLVGGAPVVVAFGMLHGAGNGLLTIVRGALPLAIFGAQGYGHRQGMLLAPARIVQALAPWAFGLALAQWGHHVLWLTMGLALLALAALQRLARMAGV